jgi:protein-tyrosine phosphatase
MIDQVFERLYVSDQHDATALGISNPLGIGADLNCSMGSDGHIHFVDITYCRLDFNDGEPIPEWMFWGGQDFLRHEYNQGKKCLSHCAAGISRSTTMAAAFLVLNGYMPDMDKAIAHVKLGRKQTNPAAATFQSAKDYIAKGRPQ